MPFGIGGKKRSVVRELYPQLPGPWQYLNIFTMFRAAEHKFRGLPPIAYPLVAWVIWSTIQKEQREQKAALIEAEREAIRRSQKVYVAKRRRIPFLG